MKPGPAATESCLTGGVFGSGLPVGAQAFLAGVAVCAFLDEVAEVLQALRSSRTMAFHEGYETEEALERFRIDDVLHAAGRRLGAIRFHPQNFLEEVLDDKVAVGELLGLGSPFIGQRNQAIRFIVDQPFLGEILKRRCDGGRRNVLGATDVPGTGDALLAFDTVDRSQVVFECGTQFCSHRRSLSVGARFTKSLRATEESFKRNGNTSIG